MMWVAERTFSLIRLCEIMSHDSMCSKQRRAHRSALSLVFSRKSGL